MSVPTTGAVQMDWRRRNRCRLTRRSLGGRRRLIRSPVPSSVRSDRVPAPPGGQAKPPVIPSRARAGRRQDDEGSGHRMGRSGAGDRARRGAGRCAGRGRRSALGRKPRSFPAPRAGGIAPDRERKRPPSKAASFRSQVRETTKRSTSRSCGRGGTRRSRGRRSRAPSSPRSTAPAPTTPRTRCRVSS